MAEHRNAAGQTKRRVRVVEIHPSLRLGPASAAPRKIECLPGSLIERLIVDAAGEAYDAVSIAGGEQPLGAGLRAAFAVAKRSGLGTALATSLLPLTRRRLERLATVLDAVAIPLYGMPQTHDRIHGTAGAFRAMAARLSVLRTAGIPFGFVFTADDANLGELAWIVRFALDEGAGWLRVRGLERGCEHEQMGPRRATRRNLRCQATIRTFRFRLDPAASADHPPAKLADLVDPLVVEADGAAVPLQHGFPRRYALGNLRCARLPVLAARWRNGSGYARFHDYAEDLLHAARAQPRFDWLASLSGSLAIAVD